MLESIRLFSPISRSRTSLSGGYALATQSGSSNTTTFLPLLSMVEHRYALLLFQIDNSFLISIAFQVMVFILSFAVFGAAGNSHLFPSWWANLIHLS